MTPTASSRSPSSRATAQVLAAKLARYDEVYGIAVAVLDHNGHVRAASRPGLTQQTARAPVRRLAGIALTGHHGEPPRAVWPWSGAPLVVAQPVINGGDVIGAVVTLSPTDRLRRSVARSWLIVVLGELIALIGCALLASRLTRWILRPCTTSTTPPTRSPPAGWRRARSTAAARRSCAT